MKNPIILEGPGFDWEQGNKAMEHVIGPDDEPNYKAAMMADPGVMTCPACGIYLWDEGTKVQCPDCGHIWEPK